MNMVTRTEKYWVIYYASVVLFITTIPYLIAFQIAEGRKGETQSYDFSGFIFGINDGNSYIAKMRSGYEGDWLFRSPYTDMEQKGFLAFFPYILLGKLASKPALHEQLVVLFHLFRIFGGALSIFATYDFIAYFIDSVYWRRVGLIIASIGGGLGWAALINQKAFPLPLEFYSPESFGFLELYGLPHLSLGKAFLFWAILSYISLWQAEGGLKPVGRLSFFWISAGLAQPLLLGLVGLIIGLHWGIMQWRAIVSGDERKIGQGKSVFWKLLLASFLPVCFILYNFIKFSTDPYLMIWNHQNQLPSANVFIYILSYGLFIPFAIIGGYRIWKKNAFQAALLVPWLIIVPLLVSLPISVQRRTIEGAWVGLVILTIYGVISIDKFTSPRYGQILVMFGLPLALIASLILLLGGMKTAFHLHQPAFIPSPMVEMMESLDDLQGDKFSVVLASFDTSNVLPAYASVRVLNGHGPESAGGEVLQREVEKFYQTEGSDEERAAMLLSHHIHYVIWGPDERELGSWNPADAAYLKLIYKNENYFIYEVDEAKLSD